MSALTGWDWFFIILFIVTSLAVLIMGVIVLRRKSRWFIMHILGDFNNPHTPQGTVLMEERYEKGVTSGKMFKSYWSFWPQFIINSVPDLNAYRFGMHLFAYRGVSGEMGDINYTFVLPPLIAKPSALKFVSKLTADMDTTLKVEIAKLGAEEKTALVMDQSKLDEFLLKTFDSDWVQRNIGIVTMKREDILLREDRVVHAAVNSDNAGFAMAHMDAWQKLMQVIWPISLIAMFIAIGLGAYFAYSGFQIAQQTTFGYDQYLATQLNQQITQTNALNTWLYQELAAINVYGVKVPQNLTGIRPISTNGGSGLPTLPSAPT